MIRKQYSQSQMDRILAVMPDEMTVWKVVIEVLDSPFGWHYTKPNSFIAPRRHSVYYYADGVNISLEGPGYHCLVKKKAALAFLSCLKKQSKERYSSAVQSSISIKMVSVRVRKQGIEGMGVEEDGNLVVQVGLMTMPIYPATEVVEQAPDVPAEAVRLMELAAV